MSKTNEDLRRYIEYLCSPEAEVMPDGTRLTNLIVSVRTFFLAKDKERDEAYTKGKQEALKEVRNALPLEQDQVSSGNEFVEGTIAGSNQMLEFVRATISRKLKALTLPDNK